MIYMHPQENDPARWFCKKCAYQMYAKDSTGYFERPEIKLPALDPIALKEDKADNEAVKDYILRRFGP